VGYYPSNPISHEDSNWRIVPAFPGFYSVDFIFDRKRFPHVTEKAIHLGIESPGAHENWEQEARNWVDESLPCKE